MEGLSYIVLLRALSLVDVLTDLPVLKLTALRGPLLKHQIRCYNLQPPSSLQLSTETSKTRGYTGPDSSSPLHNCEAPNRGAPSKAGVKKMPHARRESVKRPRKLLVFLRSSTHSS